MLKAGAAALCTAAATPAFGFAAAAPVAGGARPPRDQRRFVSPAVEQEIVRVKARIADPALRHLFETCYPNTLDTTVRLGIVDGKAAQLGSSAPALPRLDLPAYDYWSEGLAVERFPDLLVGL